jgi:hypothetical protein
VPALPTGYTASDISCIVSGCCPDCHNRI